MPSDESKIILLADEIASLVMSFTPGKGFSSNYAREHLVEAAEKLVIAAREPEENLYDTATRVGSPLGGRARPASGASARSAAPP